MMTDTANNTHKFEVEIAIFAETKKLFALMTSVYSRRLLGIPPKRF
jgi:hypothetical protein